MSSAEELFKDVEWINEEHRVFALEANLGEQFRKFLSSDVGRMLYGRSKLEYESAKEGALKCNVDTWFGRRKFNKLQRQAELADQFLRWCADAIQKGEEGYQMANKIEKGEY